MDPPKTVWIKCKNTFNFKKVIIDKLPSEKYDISMLYTYSELKNKLGGYSQVKSALERKEYFKVSHGLYSDDNPYISELENIFMRYPNAILTLQSAFAFYDLSDYIPDKYVIATAQKAHRINNDKVEQIYITNDLLNIGKQIVKTKYGYINIYDKERMLIELFRFKNRLPYPYFKEIVVSYRRLFMEEKIDNNKLGNYCSVFRNGESIKNLIQEIILWKQLKE